MWPKLSNIEDNIYNNILYGTKSGMTANSRIAWIRVFSGAKAKMYGGTKNVTDEKGNVTKESIFVSKPGLILSSAQVSNIFKAAGETKSGPYAYGGINSSGDLGVSWELEPISSPGRSSLRPSPLVTGLEIKEGKDQISREAVLRLKCFTLEQMEYMQTYFLEPGYSLCIEFGWNSTNALKQIIKTKEKTSAILKQAVDRNLDYDELHRIRKESDGDYDSFLGFIVGGNVTSDGDKWNIDVKLRGAPGLPTFLQTHQKTLELDPKGTVVGKPGEPKPYKVAETEVAGNGEVRRDRRFKNMFNQLPAQRQTDAVRALMPTTEWADFLNFDAAVNKNITAYANPGWWSSNFGGKNAGAEIKIGESTIEKEKLFSKNKYIRFDLAVKILNANGQFTAYKMGTNGGADGKDITVVFDISKTKIGAFPYMFSTKASKLVIPGWMPDFAAYFLNDGQVSQKKGGVLESNGTDYNPIRNHIPGIPIQFVEQQPLNEDGMKEKGGYWGYLKNLYINFDVFNEKIQQKNKSIRDVFLDMLNEMSSAVNSFWNFQIVEKQQDGKIIITVIDENWVGQKPVEDKIKTFHHSGANSVFLDASIDISIPSEMTNQIISRRLSLANNPDEPIVRTGGGGFFNSETDLFLSATTNVDGKVRQQLTEEEKKAQEEKDAAAKKEAEKLPSEKTQDLIATDEQKLANVSKQYGAVLQEIKDIKSKYGVFESISDADKATIQSKKELLKRIEEATDIIKDRIEAAKDTVETQQQTEKVEAEKNKQSALSNNLAKIDVLPKPEVANLPESEVGKISNVATMKNYFVIYCLNDESFFDRIKSDAFNDVKGKGTLSHPLPIKYNFKIMGTSGIRRGDMFNIIGIPTKYRKGGLFQVTQIEHQLEGNLWTTDITGEYRQMQ